MNVQGDTLTVCVLRALQHAEGPLTVNELCDRLSAQHHGYVPYGDVYVRLQRLAGAGWADTLRADRCRIWWSTR